MEYFNDNESQGSRNDSWEAGQYIWNAQAGRWELKSRQPAAWHGGESAASQGPGKAPAAEAAPAPQAAEFPRADGYSDWTQNRQQSAWSSYNWQSPPQNPASRQYTYTPADHTATPPKKRSRAPRAIAMLLACALFGFGGGMAAITLHQPPAGEKTVVYQAASGSGTGAQVPGAVSLGDIAEKAGESVVAITTENVVMDYFSMGSRVMSGAGSGVIISENGTILTNHHVVEGASNVVVTLPNGEEYEATVLGSDRRSDIAVLKIEASGLVSAIVNTTDEPRVGDFVLAIGNPTGTLQGTVTDGIVSAIDRSVTIDGVTMNLLQMSAAVSPGNSGGGLFNSAGDLIGIVNAKSSGNGTEGLGFAIPVKDAMAVAKEIIATGKVVRPGLGVMVITVADDYTAAEFGVAEYGLYIDQVNRGSGAEAAGLQAGDRIISADGSEIMDGAALSAIIAEKEVGDTVRLTVVRGGQTLEVEVILGELQQD
jgi:serine protease Do